MELLPVELRKTLPRLYSQESCPTPIVHVKLFTPTRHSPGMLPREQNRKMAIGSSSDW